MRSSMWSANRDCFVNGKTYTWYTLVKMEFIKDDSEDMSDAEACRIKDEDGEEQRGWWSFFILSIRLSWLTN